MYLSFKTIEGSNGAEQPENKARVHILSILQAQQDYFLINKTFANSIKKLRLPIFPWVGFVTRTKCYKYYINITADSTFIFGIQKGCGGRYFADVKLYAGGEFLLSNVENDKSRMVTILCEEKDFTYLGNDYPSTYLPNYINGNPSCASGTRLISP